MSFRDRPFSERINKLGDLAEGVFEQTYPEGFVRFGLNRPPINLAKVPPFLRYTPDYLTAKGLVEVQGFGHDRTFKLKLDKWEALEAWQLQFRVDLFVYDSKDHEYGWIRLPELEDVWGTGVRKSFPEGNEYWATHKRNLPVIAWEPAP